MLRIETLLKWLELLNIIEDVSERTTEYTDNMLTTLANIQNEQTELPQSIILDSGYLMETGQSLRIGEKKSTYFSKVTKSLEQMIITVILTYLRGSIAGIYV